MDVDLQDGRSLKLLTFGGRRKAFSLISDLNIYKWVLCCISKYKGTVSAKDDLGEGWV